MLQQTGLNLGRISIEEYRKNGESSLKQFTAKVYDLEFDQKLHVSFLVDVSMDNYKERTYSVVQGFYDPGKHFIVVSGPQNDYVLNKELLDKEKLLGCVSNFNARGGCSRVSLIRYPFGKHKIEN